MGPLRLDLRIRPRATAGRRGAGNGCAGEMQFQNAPLPAVPLGTNWGEQRYTPSGYNYNNYNQIPNDYPGPALTSPQGGGDGRS